MEEDLGKSHTYKCFEEYKSSLVLHHCLHSVIPRRRAPGEFRRIIQQQVDSDNYHIMHQTLIMIFSLSLSLSLSLSPSLSLPLSPSLSPSLPPSNLY